MGGRTVQASRLVARRAAAEDRALVADIGGTHVRFGIARAGGVEDVRTLRCAEHATLADAVGAYLRATGLELPRKAALAIAGPAEGERIEMTNHVWSFGREELRSELGLERLEVLNDYTALALSLPALGDADVREIKPGRAVERAPIALLGPGTGLGVAALVPAGDSWAALATEGGHRDLAAHDEREWQVIRYLQERFEHVSVERALSGPGLVNLYEAVTRIDGEEPQGLTPPSVVAGARDGSSAACVEAAQLFAGWLGAVAGDLALTYGARGGVFVGGGILPKMGEVFDAERFRLRFLAKGRFRDYLRDIPVRLIVRDYAALVGAARAV